MKIVNYSEESVRKLQQGGMVAPEAAAPAQQDPIMMLAQGAQQALQEGSCEVAMQVCQMFLELVAQASGQAPQPVGPVGQDEQIMFKRGGKMVRRKCKK